jgi:hypothetical protein
MPPSSSQSRIPRPFATEDAAGKANLDFLSLPCTGCPSTEKEDDTNWAAATHYCLSGLDPGLVLNGRVVPGDQERENNAAISRAIISCATTAIKSRLEALRPGHDWRIEDTLCRTFRDRIASEQSWIERLGLPRGPESYELKAVTGCGTDAGVPLAVTATVSFWPSEASIEVRC